MSAPAAPVDSSGSGTHDADMQRHGVTSFILLTAVAMPADGRGQAQVRQATQAVSAGHYEYRDKELAAFLDLKPDQSFVYKVDGLSSSKEDQPLHLLTRGVWRLVDARNIVLTNAPTAPPVLRQTSAVIDPKVRAAFTVVAIDDKPVEDLGLLTNGGEDGQLNMIADRGWTIPLYHEWDTDDGKKGSPTRLPRNWEIVRAADNLSLTKITFSPNGPNRFTFSYTRSLIKPFALAARPVEGEPGMIEVEFGSASIKMHKVSR
jgi:hypothetical protein